MKHLHLYWFSGSGNTLLAAEAFSDRLRELGWTVELRPLETANPEQIDPGVAFGLAFPTYFFSIPPMIRDFVRKLSRVGNTPAIMLGTHGAFSGGVAGPMKRKLAVKGFRCVAGRILYMPDSFFPFFSPKIKLRQLDRARRYAEELDADQARWPRWPILSDIHGAIFGMFFASRKLFGPFHATVHARTKECLRCDVCVRHCPMGALSRADESAVPKSDLRCTNCLRCVAICPVDAMRHLAFAPYRGEPALELRRHLDESLAGHAEPPASSPVRSNGGNGTATGLD